MEAYFISLLPTLSYSSCFHSFSGNKVSWAFHWKTASDFFSTQARFVENPTFPYSGRETNPAGRKRVKPPVEPNQSDLMMKWQYLIFKIPPTVERTTLLLLGRNAISLVLAALMHTVCIASANTLLPLVPPGANCQGSEGAEATDLV